jgi:hypothetical protein
MISEADSINLQFQKPLEASPEYHASFPPFLIARSNFPPSICAKMKTASGLARWEADYID